MHKSDEPVNARDLDVLHETIIAHGDPDASYWFVGLEENADPASKPSLDGFVRGLIGSAERFREAGKLSLDDLCGSGSWNGYQTTWGAYVKLMFAVERAGSEHPWTLDEVNHYQKHHLGALDVPAGLPRACLFELFALAHNRKLPWPYADLAEREGLEYLATRESYEARVVDRRAAALLALADEHRPRMLVCFGKPCRDVLGPRLGVAPERVEVGTGNDSLPVWLARRGASTIVFARHPAANGTPDAYWASLGRLLADRHGSGPVREAA